MLSLSNGGMSSGQAGGYFAREGYHFKGGESSQWLGKTAETLGLEGQVREEDFYNAAAGNRIRELKKTWAPIHFTDRKKLLFEIEGV